MESYHVQHWMQAKQKGRKVWANKIAFPKQVKELSTFGKELIAVVKDIKFRNTRSDFQTTLQEDIRLIHNSKKTMTFVDKTSNICMGLTKEEHNKLLGNTITSKYKKTNTEINGKNKKGKGKKENEKKGKEILKNKEVLYRLDINEESNCFFTLKDHKENFHNNPTIRLINPAKNEIGRISKVILDTINSSLIKQLKINQWKNTQNIIDL